jgi:hypothetical protein
MRESENDDNNKLGKHAQRNNSGTFPCFGEVSFFVVSKVSKLNKEQQLR